MGGEQRRLHRPVAGCPAGQRADARGVQADRFAEQHREEQVGLVAEHQPGHAPAGARLRGGEGQHAGGDVRVRALGVGVRVVPVVLADPPAAAQPDAEVAEQDAGDVAGPPGGENLPVPGVVAQEPDLGEDHRQEHGHRQLPPRVAHHGEDGPSGIPDGFIESFGDAIGQGREWRRGTGTNGDFLAAVYGFVGARFVEPCRDVGSKRQPQCAGDGCRS